MSSSKAIGGYFELELLGGGDFPHSEAVLLNSGRNCFEYLLRANGPEHVYLPKYTCDAMLEPLQKLNIRHSFYSIDKNLEMAADVTLKGKEFIVYTNYAGMKDGYCKELSQKYGSQLILDCSHAYYFTPPAVGHTFYSPRKFFGVPDGGCLFTESLLDDNFPTDVSYERFLHLIKRIDLGPEAAYEDFKRNEQSLRGQPIKRMSQLTRRVLGGIDFEAVRQKRRNNFFYLHEHLKQQDRTSLNFDTIACPMYYPLATDDKELRQRLAAQSIFTPTYWPNVFEWCDEQDPEYKLALDTIPLPIDQRYDAADMERIVGVIYGG